MAPMNPALPVMSIVFKLLLIIAFLHFFPVHNLPKGGEVRGTAVLVVQVIRVLPDVEGEDGLEAVRYGIVRVGVLPDA